MSEAALIYTTWPDADSAAKAAAQLLDDRLVACANIFPEGRSIYRWEGKVEDAAETVMLLKTTAAKAGQVRDRLIRLHPYDTPCVLGLDVKRGQSSNPFIQWLREAVKPD